MILVWRKRWEENLLLGYKSDMNLERTNQQLISPYVHRLVETSQEVRISVNEGRTR